MEVGSPRPQAGLCHCGVGLPGALCTPKTFPVPWGRVHGLVTPLTHTQVCFQHCPPPHPSSAAPAPQKLPQVPPGSAGPFISKAEYRAGRDGAAPSPVWHQAWPHSVYGAGSEPYNAPIPTDWGARGCSSPPCPRSGVFRGAPTPGAVPAWGPCARAATGGGWGMSPCLLLEAGWDGSHGNGVTGIPHLYGSHGNGGPTVMVVP